LAEYRRSALEQLDEFKTSIKTLTSVFEEYNALLQEKEKYLVNGNYEAINDIIPREEEMALKIDGAESERDRKARQLCDYLEIPQDSTVSEISERLDEENGTNLMILIARLMEALQESSLLHFNIDRMIGFQLKNIQLMKDTASGDGRINTYDLKGKYQPKKHNKFFDGKG